MTGVQEVIHRDPIWRGKANFVIGAQLPEEGRTEQLWARHIRGERFEICCIPFFVYDLALGDVVTTDANHQLARVIERSGRFVFRVWFREDSHTGSVVEGLAELGALLEWSSTNLLAVDAADEAHAQKIADYLVAQEHASPLIFETGRT